MVGGFRYTSAMIITIDGPAGSGKSTAARGLAGALGIAYLDTGATFRAVTLKALREGADLQDGPALAEVARQMRLRLTPGCDDLYVELDGCDVSDAIRSAEVSAQSRYVASSPEAREVLVALQRRLGAELGDFVSEGRDQGSVVFPEADWKFYLDADPEVRARRRCEDLAAGGEPADYEQTLEAIRRRDQSDRSRPVAPLVRPQGAVVVRTTETTPEQVVERMLNHIRNRG